MSLEGLTKPCMSEQSKAALSDSIGLELMILRFNLLSVPPAQQMDRLKRGRFIGGYQTKRQMYLGVCGSLTNLVKIIFMQADRFAFWEMCIGANLPRLRSHLS
ncbi:hypothetical protein XM38_044960 [Halomicronema hongdechloris C2206]|uniref:Uncharacterized protein n=1 Tax=Halomicronema hongdechloris C2206 TaxID=1641165 RepID=A0A1Z3HTA1_9CYAN|nr:hypothetical protein XM38_044960 [Halomicronema hongdechloris C2206]